MTEQELIARYMVDPGREPGGDFTQFRNCKATPLIDGPNYFADLKRELLRLNSRSKEDNETKNAFVYIHGWWLHHDFSLDGPSSPNRIVDLLKALSNNGVDVRAIGWVMANDIIRNLPTSLPGVGPWLRGKLGPIVSTMRFVKDLRSGPGLGDKVVCNTLAHPAGAAHIKMVLLGDDEYSIGYTGGIDMVPDRHNSVLPVSVGGGGSSGGSGGVSSLTGWSDLQMRVEGPINNFLYNHYRDIWEEIRRRPVEHLDVSDPTIGVLPNRPASMTVMPARNVGHAQTTTAVFQGGRTFPQYSFRRPHVPPVNSPLSFAPSGEFSVKTIWHKGITGAASYIYIEDQAFWSTEVMEWLNLQIRTHDDLKVILLTGVWDPNDPSIPPRPKLMPIAVNEHLYGGTSATRQLSQAQKDRICIAVKSDRVIHSKTSLVDDNWALAGSANVMRRSLYTDFESAVSFVDGGDNTVEKYRRALWDFRFGTAEPDLTRAINRWFALPPKSGVGVDKLYRVKTFPNETLGPIDQRILDRLMDLDSRTRWRIARRDLGINDDEQLASDQLQRSPLEGVS